jgi:hypothetical protein
VTIDIGLLVIPTKSKLAESGSIPQAKYSSMAFQPPIKIVVWTMAMSPESSSKHLNIGSVMKSRGAILERNAYTGLDLNGLGHQSRGTLK